MLLTEEQTMIRDMARAFAAEQLAPNAGEWDRTHAFPADAIRQMGELGLLGMLVPEEWGGAGAGHVALALAIEEVAAGDGACSTIMSVRNSVACMPILKFGSEQQKERFLRPMAGASCSALRADRAAGGLRRRQHPHARGARRRRLRAERRQAVHHLR